MTRWTRRLLLLAFIGLCSRSWAASPVEHVFIVSFDGGKPAVMRQSPMPTLLNMARQGAVTWDAHTIFPSITLPSHT
ncbi:MAG: alkaline phosphatase family protein [Armatimonadetes bacterium]|nr:alkaline phosphatase family protein [Armatimonadota bacterium]